MNLSEKLKFAMIKSNTSQIELARRTNQEQANLSRKMISKNFKLSEYEKLVTALGCTLEVNIVMPNGEKV